MGLVIKRIISSRRNIRRDVQPDIRCAVGTHQRFTMWRDSLAASPRIKRRLKRTQEQLWWGWKKKRSISVTAIFKSVWVLCCDTEQGCELRACFYALGFSIKRYWIFVRLNWAKPTERFSERSNFSLFSRFLLWSSRWRVIKVRLEKFYTHL